MPLSITVNERAPGVVDVVLDGRLDSEGAPALYARLTAALLQQVHVVTVDMSRVTYVSSMGIQVLFSASKVLTERQARLAMVGMQPHVQKVFDIVRVLPTEAVFATMEEADRYFDAIQRRILEEGGQKPAP